jgi:hypothetical protein
LVKWVAYSEADLEAQNHCHHPWRLLKPDIRVVVSERIGVDVFPVRCTLRENRFELTQVVFCSPGSA